MLNKKVQKTTKKFGGSRCNERINAARTRRRMSVCSRRISVTSEITRNLQIGGGAFWVRDKRVRYNRVWTKGRGTKGCIRQKGASDKRVPKMVPVFFSSVRFNLSQSAFSILVFVLVLVSCFVGC